MKNQNYSIHGDAFSIVKTILTLVILAIAVALFSPKAKAQASYSFTPMLTSAVYSISPTNLASPKAFFVGDRRHVAVQVTTGSATPGTTNIFYFAPSVDGITFDTNAASLYSLTNAVTGGAGTVTKCYDFDITGYGYLELYSVTSGNLTSTNTLQRSIKIQAP